MSPSSRRIISATISFWLCCACASYQGHVDKAREALRSDPKEAITILEPLANTEGKDQLVYLYDLGTALQVAKDYKKSTEILRAADDMGEVKDYHSITKQAASLLVNEEMVQYKGDDFEKVIVNIMLAIDYLMLADYEGALVETRRVNEKLDHYRTDAKRDYEQNVFAHYLSAMIWEHNHNFDDALISYQRCYELNPNNFFIQEDLMRAAIEARRSDLIEKYTSKFKIKKSEIDADKNKGEIVFLFQQGWGPRKYPSPEWQRIPKLYPVNSLTKSARVSVDAKPAAQTHLIYSVQDVSIRTLDDQYSSLVAKRIAAIAAKEVVSDQVRQKNETLGLILNIAMHVVDRADLRQWSTLPETFQVAKFRLNPGTYHLRAEGLSAYGEISGENMPEQNVTVVAGRKTFVTWRSF